MKTRTKCHCCKRPAIDANGKQKKARVCWNYIRNGGSIERKCLLHKEKLK